MAKMKSNDTSKGRWYTTPDGVNYPSVTSILSVIGKPALLNWAAKVEREMVVQVSSQLYEDMHSKPKMTAVNWKLTLNTMLGKAKAASKELAKAGEIGSQVHALVEWTLTGELGLDAGPAPAITAAAQSAFSAWQKWRETVHLKPVMIEQTVWSRKHGFAGTLDLLAEVNGELAVVDWKTGKAVYSEAHLQNAAYRHAIREMGHGTPVKGYIIRLPKNETDPQFEAVEAEPEEESFRIFLSTFELWKWNQVKEKAYEEKRDAAA